MSYPLVFRIMKMVIATTRDRSATIRAITLLLLNVVEAVPRSISLALLKEIIIGL